MSNYKIYEIMEGIYVLFVLTVAVNSLLDVYVKEVRRREAEQ